MSEMAKKGHPAGLYLLFFTEMWERFSYYGMRAIFMLFMTNALLFDKAFASKIYGNYTGLVYLTPLLGGYIADRYWGNRRSILVGGVLMAIGQFFMFGSGLFYDNPSLGPLLMFIGLGFLIFGNGFFKPNISTMVGQLYQDGDKRVDSAFTIFYMGINLGAFLAPLVCGGLGEVYDGNGIIVPSAFKWGFLAAGIGMLVSTLSFEIYKNKYLVSPTGDAIGLKPKPAVKETKLEANTESGFSAGKIAFLAFLSLALIVIFRGGLGFDAIGTFIYTACIIAPVSIITDKSLTTIEKQRIGVIYILSFFVIFFWAAFEQAGASLTFFAEEQTNREVFGTTVKASYFQSVNAVAIVIFAPLFAMLWTALGKRNAEPASPVKQALGLFLLAVGYAIIALVVKDLDPSLKVSMFWLITLYSVHTFGELCLSPIGLSMVVRLAPVRFASLLMGVWFLSTATANKFAGDLSALYPEEVKQELSIPAKTFAFDNALDSVAAQTIVLDTVFIKNQMAMGTVWAVNKASDGYPEPAKPSFSEKFVNNLIGFEAEPLPDSVLTITTKANTSNYILSDFQKKLILPKDKKVVYNYGFAEDGKKLYVLKGSNELEIWNLTPTKPSFVGFQINNLYNFFMIFVVMAGVASIILFLLSKLLLKMMHGVR